MKKNGLYSALIAGLLSMVNLNAPAQSWQWARACNGNTGSGDEGYAICNDPSGNAIITGWFNSPTINFGSFSLSGTGTTTNNNVYVAKFDAYGNALWAKSSAGTGQDFGYSISSDVSGNSFVTGYMSSPTIAFGSYTLTNSGISNFFLVKYDPNGNVLWAKKAVSGASNWGFSVSTDASGNSFVTGVFIGQMVVGTYTLNAVGSNDFFLIKFDPNGNVLWAKHPAAGPYSYGNGVATDASGNAFVTGYFVNPSLTIGTTTLSSPGYENVFIAKYDPAGNVLWAKGGVSNSALGDMGNAIATDASGSAYLIGAFSSSVIAFGTFSITNSGPANNYNSFLTKYDSNGNELWVKSMKGTQNYGLAICPYQGGVFVTGGCSTVTIGSYTLIPSYGDPLYIAHFDSNGNTVYATLLNGGGDDVCGISTDEGCNVYISGDYQGSGFQVGTTTLPTPGNENVFIAKMSYTCQPQDVEEVQLSEASAVVYPNPGSGMFTIKTDHTPPGATFSVMNMLGQKVVEKPVAEGNNSWNAEGLPKGIYTWTVSDKNRIIKTGKLIVQ